MTGEISYHRFFGYNGKIKLIETGHFESEQFTVDLIAEILNDEFPELRTIKTGVKTNPINYYIE
jgi:putative NIF3 family GTP cyclohydrolase 1 type 2